jgi:hypothetical protein
MRSKLLLVVGCVFLAACADIKETGITRASAIAIAKRACPEYPDTFSFVDRAEWIPEKGFWAVELGDRSGFHGRVYKVDRNGEIVGTRDIDKAHPVGYYDGPGPYGGPPVVVGVYGPGPYGYGPYHRRWWY